MVLTKKAWPWKMRAKLRKLKKKVILLGWRVLMMNPGEGEQGRRVPVRSGKRGRGYQGGRRKRRLRSEAH